MTSQLQELNERYGLGGAVFFEQGEGGLPRVRLQSNQATAEIYLQGAHVTAWQPAGAERSALFLSPRSHFVRGKAIRGGVPLIFPWFASRGDNLPGPMHGFVRTEPWSVAGTEMLPQGVAITFAYGADDTSGSYGYDHFSLRYRVVAGAALELSFEVHNSGAKPLTIEEALHAYFAIGDIHQVTVTGLAGTEYLDRADGSTRKRQREDAIRFTGETDQLHLNTATPITIHDGAWQRRIILQKKDSSSTVVWNPWLDKATALPDLGPEAWTGMVCVEPANAREDRIELAPGAAHTMAVQVRIEPER
jgi:glucose-6-phosphate 1-epimerase